MGANAELLQAAHARQAGVGSRLLVEDERWPSNPGLGRWGPMAAQWDGRLGDRGWYARMGRVESSAIVLYTTTTATTTYSPMYLYR